MYKKIKGELEKETVRPNAYHQKLEDGWVVDVKDLVLLAEHLTIQTEEPNEPDIP